MFNRMGSLLVILMVVLLATGACSSKSSSGELSYTTALFEIGIPAGSTLPGTEVQYRGMTDGRAEVYIEGKRALKQKADSLSWEGQVREGVSLDLDLRVLTFNESTLRVGGIAKATVTGAGIQAATPPQESSLMFDKVTVAYTVKEEETIPGTLLIYKGKTDEGAELGGTDDYPYRKVGDSIVWTGSIKDNVWLRLDLRVTLFTEKSLTVTGLASLWIEP